MRVRPRLIGKTGLWYFSTDRQVDDQRLHAHVDFLLKMIFKHEDALRDLIKKTSSHAVLTMFWNGPLGAKMPIVPDQLDQLRKALQSIPVEIETDFDTDEEGPSSTSTKAPVSA
jgi:hypothetical protein